MTDVHASRRAVFAGAGAVGIAGVLAACGGDETPAASSSTNTSTGQPTPATTTGAPAPAFSANKSDIPVGGGKIFGEEDLVITQPSSGNFVGLSATCTHQQCILAKIESGKIKCGCHGSQFTLDGKVSMGPARTSLEKKALKVDGDKITLA